MKLKSFLIAALALTGFVGNATADTARLTATDGWTKITTLPTSADIANNYYVFVDQSNDLMLGIGKGVNQNTKWYSLGVYYRASVEPTAKDFIPLTWTLESYGSGFAMRNLDQPVSPFQTEWNAAWKFDTNDVYGTANEWTEVRFTLADGVWTIQNGKYPDSGYLGPWDNVVKDGAECAANKTGASVGHFHIYAISRTQFRQNLLDNASESTPVDLTPWYVENATFDANTSDGWTTSYSANSSGWWGNHAFSNLGAENYQQVAEVKQTLTLPNGKYKVALQGATNKVSDNIAYVFGTHDGAMQKTYFTQSTVSSPDKDKWSDMQYNLLLMMQNRSYGQVMTPEIVVTTGSLTIGYKNESGHSWDVFDNFKLYCTGIDLSAYKTQLADLVSECNAFIASGVVPEACENAISSAVTTYNKTYETAKEYSAAIIALTAVLNTYRNDAALQSAYASYYAFKTKVEGLTAGVADGTTKTTFADAVSTATADVEAATTVSAIDAGRANLRTAALTFISTTDGQFDITFLASQNYADWKKKDGSAAGIVADQFLSNRPSAIPSFAESFEWTAATTGNVLYQTVASLPAGYYQVGMYAMALSTSQRDTGIATEATEGDADRSFAFAGDQRTGLPIKFATAINFDDLTTLDVNVHLSSAGALTFGVQKDRNGSNWHFAQIASIVYSRQPDLTALKATRDALVAEATGLLNGAAEYLTSAQRTALQEAVTAGNNADDFDALNTVTLTTLPNAINTAKQQVQQVQQNRVLMTAALARFENDYNLADGTDYRRLTMSADAWATLIDKVNAVSEALDDVEQSASYVTIKDALVAQMDATDASLRLFKNYKAMSEGTTALIDGSVPSGSVTGDIIAGTDTDTDATEQAAIAALNTAFVAYATPLTDDFSMNAYLGTNLDFSAAPGETLNGDNNNSIQAVTGWEVNYADADTWTVLQTNQSGNSGKLYIRKNWGSSATTMTVAKERMLPVGKYTLSLSWNSDMKNMTNRSLFRVGDVETAIGRATSGFETLTYDFDVVGQPQPFDLVLGFQKTGTGNTPAQIVVDDITLTYRRVVDTFTLTDGQPLVVDVPFTATTVTNSRTLASDDDAYTVCLPYALSSNDDVQFYELTAVDGGTLHFTEVAATVPLCPYLAVAKADASLNATNVEVVATTGDMPAATADGYEMRGTMTRISRDQAIAEGAYILQRVNAWKRVDDGSAEGVYIPAFRAYIVATTQGARPSLSSDFDVPTAIPSVDAGAVPARVVLYDLQGRRLPGIRQAKGLYIVNGKKVMGDR